MCLIQRISRSWERSNTSAWCTASIHNGSCHRNRKPFPAWPNFAVDFWVNAKNSSVLMLPPEIWTILSKQYCIQPSVAASTHCRHPLPAYSGFCAWKSKFERFLYLYAAMCLVAQVWWCAMQRVPPEAREMFPSRAVSTSHLLALLDRLYRCSAFTFSGRFPCYYCEKTRRHCCIIVLLLKMTCDSIIGN